MKATLQFDLPDERDSFEDAVHGSEWHDKFERVWQDCFRGRHKHFYVDKELNELLGSELDEEHMRAEHIACNRLMDILEQLYHRISDDD